MNNKQAKNLIRQIAYRGCIAYSKHCSERMEERSVSADDFLNVLMWGTVESVQHNPDTGHWKCRVKGVDLDKDELVLQIAIDKNEERVICITVI